MHAHARHRDGAVFGAVRGMTEFPHKLRPLALSGPMGVGKTTVANLLAARLRVPVYDLDTILADEAGCSLPELFAHEGERQFRERERTLVARLLADASSEPPFILSLGGGTVTGSETRRALLARCVVVTLRASPMALVARLGAGGVSARPLLAGCDDPADTLSALAAARCDAYSEAHAQVDTEGCTPQVVAEAVYDRWTRDPIVVPLGTRSYCIDVGAGARDRLPEVLRQLAPTGNVLVVSDDETWPHVGERIEQELAAALAPERRFSPLLLAAGEVNKTIAAVEKIWDCALARRFDRSGVLVAVGGGVVGDVTGFAAATLLRGVRVVHVPTTLLAMVDASVGGKTAIDRPEGKNLVGAFHQPSAVVVDTEFLRSLPKRAIRSGLAEMVKMALIADANFFARLERAVDNSADGSVAEADLAASIRDAIAHKARIVMQDERDENDVRAALNFGHTLGHAFEILGGYNRWTHGEAVSLGMVAALRVGVFFGWTTISTLERAMQLLRRIGLPVDIDSEPLAAAIDQTETDKKRENGGVAFIVVPEIGTSRIESLSTSDLHRALTTG